MNHYLLFTIINLHTQKSMHTHTHKHTHIKQTANCLLPFTVIWLKANSIVFKYKHDRHLYSAFSDIVKPTINIYSNTQYKPHITLHWNSFTIEYHHHITYVHDSHNACFIHFQQIILALNIIYLINDLQEPAPGQKCIHVWALKTSQSELLNTCIKMHVASGLVLRSGLDDTHINMLRKYTFVCLTFQYST